jgi:uncharacterized protein (TIGR02246 family)
MRHFVLIALAGLALVSAQAPTSDAEKEIRSAVDAYTAAFNKGDLDGVLSHFSADADFTDQGATHFGGKNRLGELLKQSLADLKGTNLKVTLTSVRVLRPDVAQSDGTAQLTSPNGTFDAGRFTAVWTKTDGKWLLNSVRDLAESPANQDAVDDQLRQLDWLVGEWTHDDPNFSVQLSGRWTLNNRFLLLEYAVKNKDGDDMIVDQYFGWDPVDGVIRSWFFDSTGGYGGGDWTREGNTWSADWKGVLSEGWAASSVNSFKFIDDNSFLFRSVEREIDGLPISDVEAKFIRKSPGK